jgi:hypothetical protein
MTSAMVQQFADLRAARDASNATPHLAAAPIERLYLAIVAFPLHAEEKHAVQERLGAARRDATLAARHVNLASLS